MKRRKKGRREKERGRERKSKSSHRSSVSCGSNILCVVQTNAFAQPEIGQFSSFLFSDLFQEKERDGDGDGKNGGGEKSVV